ncbi:hypothetical protein CDD83_3643 [Cordyceps sp. RAO-2017]|nr:hypothetical protein CDD83_3643 [Cordyceps sp. RAO-2017]
MKYALFLAAVAVVQPHVNALPAPDAAADGTAAATTADGTAAATTAVQSPVPTESAVSAVSVEEVVEEVKASLENTGVEPAVAEKIAQKTAEDAPVDKIEKADDLSKMVGDVSKNVAEGTGTENTTEVAPVAVAVKAVVDASLGKAGDSADDDALANSIAAVAAAAVSANEEVDTPKV